MRINIERIGTIQASKATLNFLVCVLADASECNENRGYKAHSEFYKRVSDNIYKELEDSGYYKNSGDAVKKIS